MTENEKIIDNYIEDFVKTYDIFSKNSFKHPNDFEKLSNISFSLITEIYHNLTDKNLAKLAIKDYLNNCINKNKKNIKVIENILHLNPMGK